MKEILFCLVGAVLFMNAPAWAANDDEGARRQVMLDSCSSAGRSANECGCFVDVVMRETTDEEFAFIADFMKRKKEAEESQVKTAAFLEDVTTRKDYYKERLEPLSKAAELASKECKAKEN